MPIILAGKRVSLPNLLQDIECIDTGHFGWLCKDFGSEANTDTGQEDIGESSK